MDSNGILIFLSATSIAVGIAGFVHAHYREKNMRFLNQCQHEITQGRIDHVLRCVEEPEPPPEKVIAGLIPPPRA